MSGDPFDRRVFPTTDGDLTGNMATPAPQWGFIGVEPSSVGSGRRVSVHAPA